MTALSPCQSARTNCSGTFAAEDERCGDTGKIERRQATIKTAQLYFFIDLKRCGLDPPQISGIVLISYVLSTNSYYKADEIFSIRYFICDNNVLTYLCFFKIYDAKILNSAFCQFFPLSFIKTFIYKH